MKEIEPGQEWQVDLMRPEEAPQVVELFKLVYGEGYPVQTFTDPERLRAENESGQTISVVARTSGGDIVGHNALYRIAPYPGVFESGAGLVHPAYRGGKGIFTKMAVACYQMGPHQDKVEVVLGEPVCNHPFAQKATHSTGFVTHALEVDLMPASAYSKEKSAPGRVSTLMDFVIRRSKPHRVYLPPQHGEFLEFCYTELEDQREFAQGTQPLPAGSGSALTTQHFDFAQVARVALTQAAQDLGQVVAAEEQALKAKGVLMIEAWLPLAWPWSGAAAQVLGEQGFFVGGIMPRWFDEDGMLLQKLMGPPHWDQIQIQFPRAQKILDMVRADWQRVSGASS